MYLERATFRSRSPLQAETQRPLLLLAPFLVKSHSSHLGTSELVGRVIQRAVIACGLPEGVFLLLLGKGKAIGQALVSHPASKLVGFAGSSQGGISLMRTAADRPEPIPVYAEMSTINPIFLFPAALDKDAETLARGFVNSRIQAAREEPGPGSPIRRRSGSGRRGGLQGF